MPVVMKSAESIAHPKPISDHRWPEGVSPVVTIFCMTYNHQDYICEALEGFLMQETDFPVEIFVHDDASQDDTQEILKEYQRRYPNLFSIVLQKENQWAKGSENYFTDHLFRQRGTFVALCEGDDYWTDPKKLQKQVSYLQNHPEVSLCCTSYLKKRGSVLEQLELNLSRVVTTQNWSFPYSLSTATAMFRLQDLMQSFPTKALPDVKDILLWRLLLQRGDAHVLPDCTAVYRIHAGGLWSLQSEFQQHLSNLKTAESMLAHFGRQRDVRNFHSVALRSCLRYLKVDDLGEVGFLMGVALRSRPQALPQLFSAWARQKIRQAVSKRFAFSPANQRSQAPKCPPRVCS